MFEIPYEGNFTLFPKADMALRPERHIFVKIVAEESVQPKSVPSGSRLFSIVSWDRYYRPKITKTQNSNMGNQIRHAPPKLGSANPQNAPYQAFRGRDRYFVVAAGTDRLLAEVGDAVGEPDLVNDSRFSLIVLRTRNQRMTCLLETGPLELRISS